MIFFTIPEPMQINILKIILGTNNINISSLHYDIALYNIQNLIYNVRYILNTYIGSQNCS